MISKTCSQVTVLEALPVSEIAEAGILAPTTTFDGAAQPSTASQVPDSPTVADRAARALEARQYSDGYWVGDLTADSTLQSDYILLQMWLSPAASDGTWNPPTMPKIRKAARAILDAQRPDGGWNIY